MAKPSMFRDFMKALRKAWKSLLPTVKPVDDSNCGAMPKSSSFYAGVAPPSGLHVFVKFDPSPKSWQVGQFKVAFILSKRLREPKLWALPSAPDDPALFTEGCYYLIHKKVRKHWCGKIWHLENNEASVLEAPWFASSYADPDVVISEAIADVTQELQEALKRIGLETRALPPPASGPKRKKIR
jgi:hypothetical protein